MASRIISGFVLSVFKWHNNIQEEIIMENKRLSYIWLPPELGRVLDIGCAWGYDSNLISKKCREVYGIDASILNILKAKKLYPHISFEQGCAEELPFPDNNFDAVIMSEVLEHVNDEVAALSEINRVLKPNGFLVLEVPHKGLFAFLDPANQKFYARKYLSFLFRDKGDKGCFHRHYSLRELEKLLNDSGWSNNYKIKKINFHGLILGILAVYIRVILKSIFGKKISGILSYPLRKLAAWDNSINFGKYSYQIALLIAKE